jgi:lipoprotein-releasing system permease protein
LPLSLFLAVRHLSSPRRSRAIKVTGLVSMGGIFFGVLALTVILSVMNGLERELAGLIQAGEAHIELTPDSPAGIADLAPILTSIEMRDGVVGAAPFVRSEILLVNRSRDGSNRMETATLIGIDPAKEGSVTSTLDLCTPPFDDFQSNPGWIMPEGAREDEGVILGVELARNLQVGLGERLRFVVPDASSIRGGDLDSLRGRELWVVVVGLIDAGLYEFNVGRAFGDIATVAEFLQVDGQAQGITVRCEDPARAPAMADLLLATPQLDRFRAETWQERNRVLFEAMEREKALMYLFLLLTVLVASLGIVGTLTLLISEKRGEIGILRTLGLSRRGIMAVIILQGWLVGLIGVSLGLLGALGIGLFLTSHPVRIPGELFVLETVPILLNPVDFIRVGAITLFVALLATLYPGWEAARMKPIEAIRAS